VQRDPRGLGGDDLPDADSVVDVVLRPDEMQPHRLAARPHPSQDLDDVLEPLLGRDAAERHEAVLARLPGHDREIARDRRVEHDRIDAVEGPHARRDELRVDEREVPPDAVARPAADPAGDAVVERRHGTRAVVPPEVHVRPDGVELRVVHVLDAPTTEVGFVVGGHHDVMGRRNPPRPPQQERMLHEGERNGRV